MFCNAVPEHCLSAIKDPIQGFRNLTLLAIRVHLNVEFLILSPVDLSNNLASLLTAYSPSVPIAKHIGLHRDVAAIQAANNSPIPETRRFWYIVESIRPCGLYDMMITAYTLINTTNDQVGARQVANTALCHVRGTARGIREESQTLRDC